MAYTWKAVDEFTIGFHTEKICARIDRAIEDYRKGKSSYISIAIHPRSGKSQIVSRYLPSHFLGEFPDTNILSTTYGMSQAYSFSTAALNVVKSAEYKDIYPDIQLKRSAAANWTVQSPRGKEEGSVTAASLLAGLAGKGAHLALLDDYCKSRESAESPTIRDKTWSAFADDFMTRLAPVHIVIILATPWHVDDVRGRIKKKMEEDIHFPKFEFIDFPARAVDYTGKGKYPGKFLFKERFNDKWYESMYSVLGRYSAASLMDCNPTIRGGNILSTANIQFHDTLEAFPVKIKYARVWDLGHKSRKKKSSNSDPTGGTLLGFRKIGENRELRIPILEIWVKDYIEFNVSSPKRDDAIFEQIIIDGPAADLVFESTLDSVDTVNQVSSKLGTVKKIYKLNVSKSKSVRIAPLEGVFEAGRVHILKASWNRRWIEGIAQFDGSETTHDEMIDNLSSGYEHLVLSRTHQVGAQY